jgi:hypothetical protein
MQSWKKRQTLLICGISYLIVIFNLSLIHIQFILIRFNHAKLKKTSNVFYIRHFVLSAYISIHSSDTPLHGMTKLRTQLHGYGRCIEPCWLFNQLVTPSLSEAEPFPVIGRHVPQAKCHVTWLTSLKRLTARGQALKLPSRPRFNHTVNRNC